MYKFRAFLLLMTATFFIVFISPSWSQEEKPKPRHAPNALPGVEPEMLTPEYWIALQEDADDVIMTPEEIDLFNEKVRNRKDDFSYGGHVWINPILPLGLPETIPGDSLRTKLKSDIKKLYSTDFYDGRNAIYNDSMKKEIEEKMNVPCIPDVVKRRFGIVVNHANMRYYPTSVPGYSDTVWELDRFQATDLLIGNPVAILHESLDGDFLYVESPIVIGWVLAKDIAIADREEIRKLTGDKNFLLAATHKVPIYCNSSFKNFARYFYFSATMPLIGNNSKGYVVKMPYRKPDSSLGVTKGFIKPDADVYTGYFPYTKRNVLTQIFKLLNTPYGWFGQDNKRDCAGTQRVLFRCFGIITSRKIWSASDNQVHIDPNMSTEEKIAEVEKIEPVITVMKSPDHVALLLGKAHNGKLYFMHQGGWGYDEGDQHFIVNRVSINEVTHKWFHIDRPNLYTSLRL